ncbi:zf-HC2 domain-containing protein [Pseudonocardia sp. MH-G8]|uniref:zf-HC2 domain-containing protein n=1 Tax=Pseudonocardia sp. MH-G8 TaxID=1854588 RepID=UPI00117B1A4A|nr:zf-HC2 domain-containing protein [Pseudonocardia sp. MH-G8]
MSRNCRHRIDIGAYLLDGVEAAEAASFTLHVAGCPQCRAEIENLEPVIRLLSAIRTASRPSPGSRWGSDRGDGPERRQHQIRYPETNAAQPPAHLRLIAAPDVSPSSGARPGPGAPVDCPELPR